ncbi:hypothetical protein COLO4_09094 [Corchorus olitorius]|uniref:Uncharacterized protein n=1 Tax=Corchorus olitorius TaxID=93759 RepID=A0A1R3KDB1_9ROSI|nr:hypothetical protein COLO4_09094 [Corchorus olitorius]
MDGDDEVRNMGFLFLQKLGAGWGPTLPKEKAK